MKRTHIGTYHYWSPEHLHRYVEEHSLRYNRRGEHMIRRMSEAAEMLEGQRLPYQELIASRG